MKLVLLVCLTTVVVLAAADATGDLQRQWADHMMRLRRVACGGPRERIVSLEELQVSPQSSEKFFPQVSILHRCEKKHFFCCSAADYSWGPVEAATVDLVFNVRDVVSLGSSFQTVSASNHTRCGCISDNYDDVAAAAAATAP